MHTKKNRFFLYFQWFQMQIQKHRFSIVNIREPAERTAEYACSTPKCIIQAWENAFARCLDKVFSYIQLKTIENSKKSIFFNENSKNT